MDDPLLAFVRSVKLADCRIVNTPNLVFLCGGPTGATPGSYQSARDYFKGYLQKRYPNLYKRVRLAEVINTWFDHDIFHDLLQLEEYIAAFSDQILLFVESPGSIAELGAFATSNLLRPKTLAVISSEYQPSGTFIADGPVRRLENEDRSLVRYCDWDPQAINDPVTLEALNDMSEELAQFLEAREKLGINEQLLDRNSHSHTMLLMADLIDILGITMETEINQCLKEWGYSVDRQHLARYFSLLEHLKIIKPLRFSDQKYYVSRHTSTYIHYDFTSSATIRDRDRARNLIRTGLPERDPRRSKVFARYLQKVAKLKRLMSKLLTDLGAAVLLSQGELSRLLRSAPRRYKTYLIPKRKEGEFRTIAQPAREVKALQYWVMSHVLKQFPVHPAAMGYRSGLNIADNARHHASSKFLLKLDFENFFPSIKSTDFRLYVEKHAPEFTLVEVEALSRILFWNPKHTNDLCLSIGAPTSPIMSNILLRDFDDEVERFCSRVEVSYTRYADDLSFSSNVSEKLRQVEVKVNRLCQALKNPKLTLNRQKTVRVSKKRSRRVTGLVLTNDARVSLGREYKRRIRASVHHFLTGRLTREECAKLR